MSAPPFRPGDRVICRPPPNGRYQSWNGLIGTVVSNKTGVLLVYYDNLRALVGRINPVGHCWGMSATWLQPYSELSPFLKSVHAYIDAELR